MKKKITMKNFMKSSIAIAMVSTALFVSCSTNEKKVENETTETQTNTTETLDFIFPKGDKGPDKFFTGNAYNIGLVAPDSIYTSAVGNVYFEPGARSNWHTHPGGQILMITDGVGYHQIEGEPIQVLHKGDVVKCPPNTRHWHGASPDKGMQQMYIVPNTEKGIVNWMEAVTDEQYNAKN